MYHVTKRGYALVVLGPLLSGTKDPFCYQRAWPPELNIEYAEVRNPSPLLHAINTSLSPTYTNLADSSSLSRQE